MINTIITLFICLTLTSEFATTNTYYILFGDFYKMKKIKKKNQLPSEEHVSSEVQGSLSLHDCPVRPRDGSHVFDKPVHCAPASHGLEKIVFNLEKNNTFIFLPCWCTTLSSHCV